MTDGKKTNAFYADLIRRKGVRPSVQRVAVYRYLDENKNHPSVDTVFAALNPLYPTLSRTTVYNTLHLFEECGLVQCLKTDDEELRYDSDMTAHIHFKCRSCGEIYDFFAEADISSFYAKCGLLLPEGFCAETLQTVIWGRCSRC